MAELTAQVVSLQEQLATVPEIVTEQLPSELVSEIALQAELKFERMALELKEQQVTELTFQVASLQEQLATAPEMATEQLPSTLDSEVELQAEPKSELLASESQEQQRSREEELTVTELTAQVTSLQEQLDTASNIIAEHSLSESDVAVDLQIESKSELLVLESQEQQKMAELAAKVASLQKQLKTASTQERSISAAISDSGTELVAVDADNKTKRIIEALLFASEQPMTVKQLQAVFPELEAPNKQQLQDAVDALRYDYKDQGISLHKVASGYRFQVKVELAFWVARLFAEKPPKYSRALLETIAIIAYQQPVTRGDIEEIRGVSVSSNMIRTLLDREWVTVLAHKEVPGRPALYGTTRQFLDYFNLDSLEGMPPLEELQALALEGELEV